MNSPYIQSEADGVWQRHAHQAFGYSDGDEAENRMAAVISEASDCSVFSDELHGHIRDWPSMYHLSSLRSNLMRPLKPLLQGSVLEIGSGCGAITRYLGETAQSVLALEGSRRRAHITRMRTRDLGHVQVYCDEFSAFSTQDSFDAVTLIGVLEYAHLFVQGEQPALQMLSKARERLKRDGCLIIAIENQLGLKYFAGAPEDHLGQAMVGIENRYEAGGVRTYGKQALTTLLRSAGFESIDFLYPFPDYKLPVSVLSQRAFEDPRFDASAFLTLSAGKDPQLAGVPGFSMERVWPVICANALAPQLANSFLIVARPHRHDSIDVQLAWHYGSRRNARYSKETTFLAQPQGQGIEILRRPLTLTTESSGETPIRQVIEDTVGYEPLPLLSDLLIDTVTRPGWTDEQLATFLLKYAKCLTRISGCSVTEYDQVRWDCRIDGRYYDCIPQNIRMHPDGSCSTFDLEWRLSDDLTLVRLVLRTFWHTLGGLSLVGQPQNGGTPSALEVTMRALKASGYVLTEEQAQELVRSELDLQREITGTNAQFDEVWNWLAKGTLRYHSQTARLTELGRHTDNLTRLLADHQLHSTELARQLADHQQHSSNLSQEIRNRDIALSAFQARIVDLEHSQAAASADLDACRRLLQGRAQELNVVKETADQGNHLLRKAMLDQSRRLLLDRSLRNAVRLMKDYRRAISLSTTQPTGTLLRWPWSARLSAVLRQKPTLTVLASAETEDQVRYLLSQSCQWSIPFEWCFIAPDPAIAQTAMSTARGLDIPVSVLQARTDVATGTTQYPDAQFLATFRNVGAEVVASALPNPEQIRLAYVALVCNPRLAAAVITPPGASGTGSVAVFKILRRPFPAGLQTTISREGQRAREELENELERVTAAAASSGQHILLM